MVCLTSCVFRSIRFSGFARPHFGVRREGELYTRLQGGGKRRAAPAQDAHKLGNNSRLRPSLHRERAPADSRGPTGRFPPHAEARTSHVAHAAGFGSPPACTGASPCLPERRAARQAGPSHVWGPLAAHPHPRAHASLPGLLAHIRGPALADGLAAQGAARVRCQTRVAQCFGPPRPRLRRGRYGGPACPRLLARAASPRRHRRARAPRRPWDAGSKSGCKFLYALFCCGLAAGDVGLDAQHDAHGEDADDCGDAGDRRVQRGLPTLSAPPTRPTSYSQDCIPPT